MEAALASESWWIIVKFREDSSEPEELKTDLQAKIDFLNFFWPENFPYISEELTDKYHLRKSILACIGMYCNENCEHRLEQ